MNIIRNRRVIGRIHDYISLCIRIMCIDNSVVRIRMCSRIGRNCMSVCLGIRSSVRTNINILRMLIGRACRVINIRNYNT